MQITALEGVVYFESYVKAGRSYIQGGGYPVLITFIDLRKKMVERIRKDDPESVVYHIDEIVKINKMKPDIKSLKSIHETKNFLKIQKLLNKKSYTYYLYRAKIKKILN